MARFNQRTKSQGFACVGLINPKSPENVGAVMRAAGCYGASSVFYTGSRYDRAKPFYTDNKQRHLDIPLIGVDDLMSVLPHGTIPVAVDLLPDAKPLPEYKHPPRAFYIFGPEDGTLEASLTSQCRDKIYIPTNGCMNLAATVNVILYDRLAKGRDFSNH